MRGRNPRNTSVYLTESLFVIWKEGCSVLVAARGSVGRASNGGEGGGEAYEGMAEEKWRGKMEEEGRWWLVIRNTHTNTRRRGRNVPWPDEKET